MSPFVPFVLSVLSVLSSLADLGPHPVERVRMGDTAAAVNYVDKMSDGTFRDSQIIKPAEPVYPARIELIATNDVSGLWQLVYAAHFDGGSVETNIEFIVKTSARDRLKTVPVLALPSSATAGPAAKPAALAHAKARAASETNAVVKMGKRQAREISARMANGKIVRTLTDGTVTVEPLRVAHTARVTAPDPAIKPPAGNKYNAKELAAFAAGVAAALAAYGINRKAP